MEKTQETVTFDECLKKIKKSLEIMGIR